MPSPFSMNSKASEPPQTLVNPDLLSVPESSRSVDSASQDSRANFNGREKKRGFFRRGLSKSARTLFPSVYKAWKDGSDLGKDITANIGEMLEEENDPFGDLRSNIAGMTRDLTQISQTLTAINALEVTLLRAARLELVMSLHRLDNARTTLSMQEAETARYSAFPGSPTYATSQMDLQNRRNDLEAATTWAKTTFENCSQCLERRDLLLDDMVLVGINREVADRLITEFETVGGGEQSAASEGRGEDSSTTKGL